MKAKQTGFTLIELVIVIVILGILAAVAAPRFMNVQNDAKISAMKTTLGSVRTGIAIAHGKILATGQNTGKGGINPDWPTQAELDGDQLAVNATPKRTTYVAGYKIYETDATPATTLQMPSVNLPDMSVISTPTLQRTISTATAANADARTVIGGGAGWAYFPGDAYDTNYTNRLLPAVVYINESSTTNQDGAGVAPHNW